MALMAVPSSTPTPEEVIQGHANAMADICKRLVRKVEELEAENRKVHYQLNDALDAVHEKDVALRGKDQIIEELQELLNAKSARKK